MYPPGLSKQRWLQTSLQGLGTGKKKKKVSDKAVEEAMQQIAEVRQSNSIVSSVSLQYHTPKI